MAYQPIENYGIIGNMHTVALVGMNGSIDWFCCPHFDSASVSSSPRKPPQFHEATLRHSCAGVRRRVTGITFWRS